MYGSAESRSAECHPGKCRGGNRGTFECKSLNQNCLVVQGMNGASDSVLPVDKVRKLFCVKLVCLCLFT
jgi:hypothetical protein